ncbi:MAG: hypothetical protein EXR92_03215 [Gemmatimonadetes bacterium]|nr:hypothetical protein [Gemmatimonadota bacterium]
MRGWTRLPSLIVGCERRWPRWRNTSRRTMNEVPRNVRGIVVTHGSMCFGMVDAVRSIAGPPADALIPISNEGKGPEELLHLVSELTGEGPSVIFTDLHTGSCALAARLACRDPEGRRVVFGTNLAMLLDFVFHRHLPLDELVERVVNLGRAAVRAFESGEERVGNRPVSGG